MKIFIDFIKEEYVKKRVYIFGAHSRGQTTAIYLQTIYSDISVEAYLYDNDESNPDKVSGVPVVRLDRKNPIKLHTDYPVYIGTRGIYHEQVRERLKELGFKYIYPVTVELDIKLRNLYMEKHFASIGCAFTKIDTLSGDSKERLPGNNTENGCGRDSKSAAIYVAVSKNDKTLHREYKLASYEKKIQTGAACWENSDLEKAITDDMGDNISGKNRQFCELTALYWIWKHAREDIIGLAQYRRHFILPEDWIQRMEENDVDVILPVPLYVAPSIAGNYKSRHDPSDWDAMMAYLKRRDTEEYQEAEAFFQTNLYSPCNMFIMRRQVLDKLCAWLFPILFVVAEQGGHKENGYLNRYPGFISERLITFFFEMQRNKYKIVYCDKMFLE